jgi:hypothetical protein
VFCNFLGYKGHADANFVSPVNTYIAMLPLTTMILLSLAALAAGLEKTVDTLHRKQKAAGVGEFARELYNGPEFCRDRVT